MSLLAASPSRAARLATLLLTLGVSVGAGYAVYRVLAARARAAKARNAAALAKRDALSRQPNAATTLAANTPVAPAPAPAPAPANATQQQQQQQQLQHHPSQSSSTLPQQTPYGPPSAWAAAEAEAETQVSAALTPAMLASALVPDPASFLPAAAARRPLLVVAGRSLPVTAERDAASGRWRLAWTDCRDIVGNARMLALAPPTDAEDCDASVPAAAAAAIGADSTAAAATAAAAASVAAAVSGSGAGGAGAAEGPYAVVFVGMLPRALRKELEQRGADGDAGALDPELLAALRAMHCFPVLPPPALRRRWEEGLCRDVLWPLLHYLMPAPERVDPYCPPATSAQTQAQGTHGVHGAAGGGAPLRAHDWTRCWAAFTAVSRLFAHAAAGLLAAAAAQRAAAAAEATAAMAAAAAAAATAATATAAAGTGTGAAEPTAAATASAAASAVVSLEPGTVWAHNYHLLRLCADLRPLLAAPPPLVPTSAASNSNSNSTSDRAGASATQSSAASAATAATAAAVFAGTRLCCFLHAPFPSSDLFRALPWRETLLSAMLAADLLGFHAFDFARHFLASCQRVLSLQVCALPRGLMGVRTRSGRIVAVLNAHVGVHSHALAAAARAPAVGATARRLRRALCPRGEALVLAVSEVSVVKSVHLQVRDFRALLTFHAPLRGVTRLLLVLLPASGPPVLAAPAREAALAEVALVRARFGPDAVVVVDLSTDAAAPPAAAVTAAATAAATAALTSRGGGSYGSGGYGSGLGSPGCTASAGTAAAAAAIPGDAAFPSLESVLALAPPEPGCEADLDGPAGARPPSRQHLSLSGVLPLYLCADVLLVAPFWDGVNTAPLEVSAAQAAVYGVSAPPPSLNGGASGGGGGSSSLAAAAAAAAAAAGVPAAPGAGDSKDRAAAAAAERERQAAEWSQRPPPAAAALPAPSPIVVSEFLSCARALVGVHRANPWSAEQTAAALALALKSTSTERFLALRGRLGSATGSPATAGTTAAALAAVAAAAAEGQPAPAAAQLALLSLRTRNGYWRWASRVLADTAVAADNAAAHRAAWARALYDASALPAQGSGAGAGTGNAAVSASAGSARAGAGVCVGRCGANSAAATAATASDVSRSRSLGLSLQVGDAGSTYIAPAALPGVSAVPSAAGAGAGAAGGGGGGEYSLITAEPGSAVGGCEGCDDDAGATMRTPRRRAQRQKQRLLIQQQQQQQQAPRFAFPAIVSAADGLGADGLGAGAVAVAGTTSDFDGASASPSPSPNSCAYSGGYSGGHGGRGAAGGGLSSGAMTPFVGCGLEPRQPQASPDAASENGARAAAAAAAAAGGAGGAGRLSLVCPRSGAGSAAGSVPDAASGASSRASDGVGVRGGVGSGGDGSGPGSTSRDPVDSIAFHGFTD